MVKIAKNVWQVKIKILKNNMRSVPIFHSGQQFKKEHETNIQPSTEFLSF